MERERDAVIRAIRNGPLCLGGVAHKTHMARKWSRTRSTRSAGRWRPHAEPAKPAWPWQPSTHSS